MLTEFVVEILRKFPATKHGSRQENLIKLDVRQKGSEDKKSNRTDSDYL